MDLNLVCQLFFEILLLTSESEVARAFQCEWERRPVGRLICVDFILADMILQILTAMIFCQDPPASTTVSRRSGDVFTILIPVPLLDGN